MADIDEHKHLELIGLWTLARSLNAQLNSVVDAAVAITGDPDGRSGHTSDWLYSAEGHEHGIKELLARVARRNAQA